MIKLRLLAQAPVALPRLLVQAPVALPRFLVQAPVALPRRFAEILCPDFGFGSLREFRPRCRSFTVIHQVLPQNCASSVRKIYSQITLVQLCGIALRVESEELSTLFLYTRKRERVEKISTLHSFRIRC